MVTPHTHSLLSRGRATLVGWLLLLVALLVAVPTYAGPGRTKMDRHVQQATRSAAVNEPLGVIVTMKPGAKRGLLEALRQAGARVNTDFPLSEAFAAQLSSGMLAALDADPDVDAISIDAPVTAMGLATAVSGTAANTPFSLRSTLGLVAPSSQATTRTFQLGDANGYAGTVDGGVDAQMPSTSQATATRLWVENGPNASAGMLIRFDNLFGPGAKQIPFGATITSATLRVSQYADGQSPATASLHRMLVAWDASATWNTTTTSGVGIQRDDVEASALADASIAGLATTGNRTAPGDGHHHQRGAVDDGSTVSAPVVSPSALLLGVLVSDK